jgi:MraZ protein
VAGDRPSFSSRVDHSLDDKGLRDPARYLFAHTDRVACDSQGRLFLPAVLRAYARIDRDVVSNGNNARVEIWSRELFEQRTAAFEAKLAAYSSADDEGKRSFPEIPGLL